MMTQTLHLTIKILCRDNIIQESNNQYKEIISHYNTLTNKISSPCLCDHPTFYHIWDTTCKPYNKKHINSI